MPITQLLFSFQGRLNRQPYWLTTLAMVVVMIVIVGVVFAVIGGSILTGDMTGLGVGAIFLLLIYIPLLWIGLALGVKRLHDRNKSGWWLLVFWLVPGVLQGIGSQMEGIALILSLAGFAISIWGLVELGFLRGTVGPNGYGPDPLEAPMYPPR